MCHTDLCTPRNTSFQVSFSSRAHGKTSRTWLCFASGHFTELKATRRVGNIRQRPPQTKKTKQCIAISAVS